MGYHTHLVLLSVVLVFSEASSPTKVPIRTVPVCGQLIEEDREERSSSQSSRDHIVALPSMGDSLAVSLPSNRSDDSLRCSLFIQSCPSCLISIDLGANLSILSRDQPVPPPACLDGRMEEACFALNFVEDSSDSPSSFYRSIAIWSLLNDDETRFVSSGSSVRIVLELWAIEKEKILPNFIDNLFPLHIKILNNTEILEGFLGNSNLTTNNHIQSPRYPSAYPRDVEKTFLLQNSDANGVVRISFDDFNIDNQSELEVVDSDGSLLFSSRIHFRRPPSMESSGNTMSVHLKANGFTQEIGFRAKYEFTKEIQWSEMPSDELCDLTLDGFGGSISLDGRTDLLDKDIDCVFVVQRRNSLVGRNYDRLFLRVDEFRLHGDHLSVEVREGSFSTGDHLISLYDAQQTDELLAKQPKSGFIDSSDDPAFYIRLKGLLKSTVGFHLSYSFFYRWSGPICPGSLEFRCTNQRCIKASLHCDGIDNCGDGSDELSCDGSSSISDLTAMIGEFPVNKEPQAESDISALLALVLGICGVVVIFLVAVTVVLKIYDRRRRRGGRRVPTVDATGAALPHHTETAPSMQTVGERRFYVLPETQISVIEAPPSYDDALKHPSVPSGHSGAYSNAAFVGEPPPEISPRVDTPVPSFEEELEEIKDQPSVHTSLSVDEDDRPCSSTGSPSRSTRKRDGD
ncbi:hypothetical protein PMAYCL1PPCAC_23402 [Pristionchus mayeri]|uniref:CUB domain-containing protein n=1 Tax=Pristionchus mayeri TaxID=1317129 RepID=A0AAN5CZ70_9BILA|nr:hypothetical protein PMAYCL1PPCAC_23402 [Pristionchus mayeri]